MYIYCKITDTGEAVVDDDDGDALFAMDDVHDGTTDKKKPEMDEVRVVLSLELHTL